MLEKRNRVLDFFGGYQILIPSIPLDTTEKFKFEALTALVEKEKKIFNFKVTKLASDGYYADVDARLFGALALTGSVTTV